jgi:hypothetical protein
MKNVPASSAAHALRVSPGAARDDDDVLDAETTEALLRAYRRHSWAIAIGVAAPLALGVALLLAANAGAPVPWQALVATFAMGLAAAPFAMVMDRRAFLLECTSLGLSSSRAKEMYARHLRQQARFSRTTPDAAALLGSERSPTDERTSS